MIYSRVNFGRESEGDMLNNNQTNYTKTLIMDKKYNGGRMDKSQYFKNVNKMYDRGDQRYGQCLYNALPLSWSREINGGELDPFHKETKSLSGFMEWLEEKFLQTNTLN